MQCRRPGFDPLVGEIPCRRERLLTPVFWPREFNVLYSMGLQRVGHDRVTFTFTLFTTIYSSANGCDGIPVELFKIAKSESRSVVCDSATRPWNSLGQNTGVSSLSLLQRILPTQGSNPCLLHWQAVPPGKPLVLFSRYYVSVVDFKNHI